MFQLLVLLILVLQSNNCHAQEEEIDEVTCISNYQQLKSSLRNNSTDNIRYLLDTFYPPNKSTVHVVWIYYCIINSAISYSSFNCTADTANYTYWWVDNGLLTIIDYQVLGGLSFNLAHLISSDLELIIHPFCSDVENELQLLNTLTSWVSMQGC